MAVRIPKVAVIGSCLAEMSIRCDGKPQSGKIVNGSSFVCKTAGTGVLQATQAALCGCQVSLIGSIGEDSFGEMICDNLSRYNVDTSCLFKSQARTTGIVMTMVDNIGENISCLSNGANNALSKDHIESVIVEQLISQCDCLSLDNCLDSNVLDSAIKIAKLHSVKTVLAVNMSIREAIEKYNKLPKEFLDVNILVADTEKETSYDSITGNVHESKLAAAELVAGGVQCVIVRTGRKGCCVVCRDSAEHINNFTADTVSLACGRDAFLGALAACVAVGDPFNKSVHFAMAAEIIASRKRSSQDNMPKKTEILELLNQFG